MYNSPQREVMESIFIDNQNSKYFERTWQIYEESFPVEERRTLEEQIQLFDKKIFKMLCYVENETVIAIVFYWTLEQYTFLEHFAIDSTLRGLSYGSKILQEFLKNHSYDIVLEIEPIVDTMTQKRLRFYERFGFVVNSHTHFQVPFRKDAKQLQLLFLSFKKQLSLDEYNALYQIMQKNLSSVEYIYIK